MNFKFLNRQFLSTAILLFYLVPLCFFSFYSISLMSRNKSWSILSIGLLTIIGGALTLILIVYYWEQALKDKFQEEKNLNSLSDYDPKVTSLDPSLALTNDSESILKERLGFKESIRELNLLQISLKECQEQKAQFIEELQGKSRQLHLLEEDKRNLSNKAEHVAQDYIDYKVFSEEQLKQKNLQISHLQQTIDEQKAEMEKRQEQISQLDTKVHDLSYEIKTLLYLNETEQESPASLISKIDHSLQSSGVHNFDKSSQNTREEFSGTEVQLESNSENLERLVKNPNEALVLLRKCVSIAQKLVGSTYHYGNEASRYWEPSLPHFTIDQRRLFDNLRHENEGLILVYSQRDQKLIFVNNQSKSLVGWSPEKFVQDFPSLIQDAQTDWKRAINSLTAVKESQARLLIKSKNGQEMCMHCHLGIVPTGLFRNYIIGVLYPA